MKILYVFGVKLACRRPCKRRTEGRVINHTAKGKTANCCVSGCFLPSFASVSDFSTPAPGYNGFCAEKEEQIPNHAYRTYMHTSRYVGTYGTDGWRSIPISYTNTFTTGSMPQKPQTRRPWLFRTLLVCSRLYSCSCWAR